MDLRLFTLLSKQDRQTAMSYYSCGSPFQGSVFIAKTFTGRTIILKTHWLDCQQAQI